MNRKSVAYNWDIKVMKNTMVQIFACGAILALQSRFLFILSYFQHILGYLPPKCWLKLITMNRKNVVYNWEFKIMKNAKVLIFACGTNLALKSRFLFILSYILPIFWFSIPKYWLKVITMNRKNAVQNWEIKIMKNAMVKIFPSGAILALKSL